MDGFRPFKDTITILFITFRSVQNTHIHECCSVHFKNEVLSQIRHVSRREQIFEMKHLFSLIIKYNFSRISECPEVNYRDVYKVKLFF